MQREIYISGGNTEPVKVLKGLKVLQDGSTLQEHGITDGSTISILKELEQCISINVICGPKIYRKEITNSVTVRELKFDLVTSNQVTFPFNQFKLVKELWTDDEVEGDDVLMAVELDDEDVPLHHLGIYSEANLTVVASFIMINILNVNGEYLYKRVPKDMTVKELKTAILHSGFDYYDFVMFIKIGNDTFLEMGPVANYSVGELLTDDDTLYLTTDTFFKSDYPLYYNGSETGKIGVAFPESVLNLKLWTQVQTGIPVSNIRVLQRPPPKRFQVPVKPEVNINANVYQNGYRMGSTSSINPLQDNFKLPQHSKYYIEIF